MRISVTSGDREVHVHIKGKSRKKLAAAEGTARRLLKDAPEPEPKSAIGFGLAADTERAPEDA